MAQVAARLERDIFGEKAVPADAYYGARTARAIETFRISGVELRLYPQFIKGLGMVKLAAARANFEFGRLPAEVLQGIEGACLELIDGHLVDEFRVDVFQGNAVTATNTNANEVIANRGLELMGHAKGEYAYCDPQEHVNCSQSPGDVYPMALCVGITLGHMELVAEVKRLVVALHAKGDEFAALLTMVRPRLRDAAPMTLGQEFETFARMLAEEVRALVAIQRVLREVRIGAASSDAEVNSPADFASRCARHLTRIAGFPIRLAYDRVDPILDWRAFVLYSSGMKSLAVRLSRISNDLRLLSGGSHDLREIDLPLKLPGDSSASGTVSPVIPEVVNMVCLRVIGGDLTVTLAAEAGQLQRHVLEPVIAACIFEAQTTCRNAARMLRLHCVEGITANPARLSPHDLTHSYARAGELATEVMKTGRGIVELLQEKKVLSEGRGTPTGPSHTPADKKRPPKRGERD